MLKFCQSSAKAAFTYLLLLTTCLAIAQQKKSGEIGLALGGTYYLGEYNKTPFKGTKLSAGAFYRHTIDTRFAITGSFFYGNLYGNVENSDYLVPDHVPSTFNNSFYEISPVAEFNFVPFLPGKPQKYYFTPYVFAGGGAAYYPKGDTKFILSIPFGMGAKFNINHKIMFGVFAGMRKTLLKQGDMLDYEYYQPSPSSPIKQWGYANNKDWYSIFGVSLSYKINYRVKCPAFD